MNYERKYNLTLNENIFLAKRKIVDTIYKQARLEGINITFPQTKVIYEQGIIDKMNVEDITKVINLKRAWMRLFNTIKEPLNLEYIKKIHYDVSIGEALTSGELRNGEIGVEGVNYIPKIPIENDIENLLNKIENMNNPIDKALEYIAEGIKNQFFWDCNKRLSFIIANKILINNGCGIIAVPEESLLEFHQKLKNYYDKNKKEEFKEFLYNTSIVGMTKQENELYKIK